MTCHGHAVPQSLFQTRPNCQVKNWYFNLCGGLSSSFLVQNLPFHVQAFISVGMPVLWMISIFSFLSKSFVLVQKHKKNTFYHLILVDLWQLQKRRGELIYIGTHSSEENKLYSNLLSIKLAYIYLLTVLWLTLTRK